jgi:hypothetical protein
VVSLIGTAALFEPPLARADIARQMNLEEMCRRAGKIFQGTVVSAVPGEVEVGGGRVPVVTYRLRVAEAFKGGSEMSHGVRYTEIRMLRGRAPQEARESVKGSRLEKEGKAEVGAVYSHLPQLSVGQSYLLLTTRPSRVGMSSTVGLGQGSFRIEGYGDSARAVNGAGNERLFRGMEARDVPARGPVPYPKLAEKIRRLVESERNER